MRRACDRCVHSCPIHVGGPVIDYATYQPVNHVDLVAWIRRRGLATILLGIAAWAVTLVTGYFLIGVRKVSVEQ